MVQGWKHSLVPLFGLVLSFVALTAFALPNRDTSTSIGDVLKAAAAAKSSKAKIRYSNSNKFVKQTNSDLVQQLYGTSYLAPAVPTSVDNTSQSCSFYSSRGYDCVPYHSCRQGEIVTDGGGMIDIRLGAGYSDVKASIDPTTSKCPGLIEVCCRNPDFVPTSTLRPRTTQPPNVYYPRCGRRNVNGVQVYIQNPQNLGIGSKDPTQFGEWPHACAILNIVKVNQHVYDSYVGGSSLITPRLVLTGGHVVKKFNLAQDNLIVRCGEWDTQSTNEPIPHQNRKVIDIVIDPEYNGLNLHHDVALVAVDSDFILGPTIDTICLPPPSFGKGPYNIPAYLQKTSTKNNQESNAHEYISIARRSGFSDNSTLKARSYPNYLSGYGTKYHMGESDSTRCVATGWGKDKFGSEGEYQVVMKQVGMDLVSNVQCQNSLRETRLGKYFKLDNSFVCAGGEKGRDTCRGDGGGPLVCERFDGSYVQVGIVAWGINCGKDNTPGVYASIQDAMCFIEHAANRICSDNNNDLTFLHQETFYGCEGWAAHKRRLLERGIQNARNVVNRKRIEASLSNFNALDDRQCLNVDISDFGRSGTNQ